MARTLPPDVTDGGGSLRKPEDHEARMEVARRAAEYTLGGRGWADQIIEAYWTPSDAQTGDDD